MQLLDWGSNYQTFIFQKPTAVNFTSTRLSFKHILIFIYTASFHLNLTHPCFEKKNKFSVFIWGRKKFTFFSFQEPKQQQNYIFFFPTRTNCNHNDLSTNAKWSLRWNLTLIFPKNDLLVFHQTFIIHVLEIWKFILISFSFFPSLFPFFRSARTS